MVRKLLILILIAWLAGCVTLRKDIKPMTAEDFMRLAEQTEASRVTALSANTTPISTDIMYLVDDPGGTPASQKITLGSLFDTEDVIGKKSFEDEDWGDVSVSSNSVTLNGDVVDSAEIADDAVDSEHYAADSIDNEHINWTDIDYLTNEGAGINEAYASGWNADVGPPEKDDIYDYLHQIDTDDDGSLDDESITPTRDSNKYKKWTSAPTGADLVAGQLYYADGAIWNPGGLSGSPVPAHYVYYDGAGWILDTDEDGNQYVKSISLPSYAHFATADAAYNDTSTPHVLTASECKNGIITNAGAAEDRVYTFPAAFFGGNGMGQVIAAFQKDYEPYSGEAFWLNGTQMAVDEHIQNTADTKGDVITFWSVESGDGTYEWFFKSDNANFVEATP